MSSNREMVGRYARFLELRAAGLSREQIADELGVSVDTIGRYQRSARGGESLPRGWQPDTNRYDYVPGQH